MSLLTRYLLRQNIFLIVTTLLAGTGLYLLTDLFERLDDFLEAGVSAKMIVVFFVLKMPMIISQILPAVFLLALVVQLNFWERSRELTALYAGGVSPLVLFRFIIFYGLIWAVGQFFFSQVLGVAGDRAAGNIWQVDVKGNDVESVTLHSRWMTDARDDKIRIIYFSRAIPDKHWGEDLLVYTLDGTGIVIEEILRAESFIIKNKSWELRNATKQSPAAFTTEKLERYELPIRQNLQGFQALEKTVKPSQLPFWDLGRAIKQLEKSGSNVEVLRTVWHTKLAYAVSIMVMGLLALVVSRVTSNIYKAVGFALLLVFAFYSINTFCITLGEKGITSPPVAAWFADGFLVTLCLFWLSLPWLRRRLG